MRNTIKLLIPGVLGGGGGVVKPPFDDFTFAAAYSVRKLRSDYSGACLRVRRSSDNTEQDIGFTANGDFDSAAFTAFVGGGNGFCRTWYDQSGNGVDAGQSATSAQPQLILNVLNGKPVLRYGGVHVLSTSAVILSSAAWSINAAFRFSNIAASRYLVYNGAFASNNGFGIYNTGASGNRGVLMRLVASCEDGAVTTNAELWTWRRTAAPVLSLRVNGESQVVSNSTANQIAPTGATHIGGRDAAAGNPLLGDISELLFTASALSDSNVLIIESSQSDAFGI